LVVAQVAAPLVIGSGDGEQVQLAALGVRFLLSGVHTGGGFSLVEHPLGARQLGAPLHRHQHEDEYSFVLEGRFGALIGEEVVEAEPGTLVCKPRGIWHTFWNAGDSLGRVLEIISPAGFEEYFREAALAFQPGVPPDAERLARARERYDLDMEPQRSADIIARFGLQPPPAGR
jgi:mannose-6-phosphate isomerase-like protein (cupin superfamily)